MTQTTITVTTKIDLDVKTAAAWFCGLDDEAQAQFLIEVQAEAGRTMGVSADSQWCYAMGHLKTCECSNEATRQMVRDWAAYLNEPSSIDLPRRDDGEHGDEAWL